ncbi:MAG TPA: hypothetical protein VJH95_04560 [Candidatus Nanoarchaeia archaeon]|nr:hypothetical protein [Candidatus Nanoarchaeia archaeon]
MDNNRIQGLEPGRVIVSKNARALGFDYKGEKLWAVIYGDQVIIQVLEQQ